MRLSSQRDRNFISIQNPQIITIWGFIYTGHLCYTEIKGLPGGVTNLLWLMYESPVYIYAINLLISMVPVVVILFINGKGQLKWLLYVLPVVLIFEPVIVYTKYASIPLTFLAIVMGIVIYTFLYHYYHYEHNYLQD